MKNKVQANSRREFMIKAATAAMAGPLLFTNDAVAKIPAGAKLRHAAIGVGGMGWGDLKQFEKRTSVEIVALCDVDEKTMCIDVNKIEDPTSLSNLKNESGRGIFIIRNMSNKLEYNEKGNRIQFKIE